MTNAPNDDDLLPQAMFRAYDIRGIAGRDLTPQSARLLGRAIARLALSDGLDRVLFAADGRLSSPLLGAALKDGILSEGCHIVDLGLSPTPLLYFATHTTDIDFGVMLTASHNPADYNGIKIVRQRHSLTQEKIQDLRTEALLLSNTTLDNQTVVTRGHIRHLDIVPAYLARVTGDITLKRRLKVVVDCGNAVPGLIAPDLLSALGCEVTALFCDVDGNFPNHHPDPTVNDNLQSLIHTVKATNADVGIGLDGDGDRVVMITNAGNVIDTDRLMMLFVRDIVPRYPQPNVVFDVKCSHLLAGEITANGGRAVMSRSGHSFMKQQMQESGAVLGGEFSAHIFIKDRWYGYDDGLYVAARFLEILANGNSTSEQLLLSLPGSIVTPELRIEVSEERKFELMERLVRLVDFPLATVNCLDGIRADFKDGWGLIRASNTTPALLLRFEAVSRQSLQHIQDAFRLLLKQVDPTLDFVN
ncbi:phosphomannomutase/phosphoglucomutase [Gammaproteobacteria bacterium LSUCC0112]|nr:phosphomannomutase/phosphoglucomutase [Gammaproteobacteria bacterium LSUCC0112]